MLKWLCNLLSMTDKSRISRWLPLTPQTNLLLGNGLATDGRGPDEVAAACCCCGSCCGGVATAVPGRTIGGGLNDPPGLCVFLRKQYSSLMSKTDSRMRSKLGFIVCLFSTWKKNFNNEIIALYYRMTLYYSIEIVETYWSKRKREWGPCKCPDNTVWYRPLEER